MKDKPVLFVELPCSTYECARLLCDTANKTLQSGWQAVVVSYSEKITNVRIEPINHDE